MAKCSACGKFLKPSAGTATCTTCPCLFHKGCVAIPEGAAMPHDWSCPECKKTQRKGDNSSTPVKGICGASTSLSTCNITDSQQGSPAIVPCPNAELIVASDIQQMRRELAEYMIEARRFRDELRDSMAGLGKRMDSLERRLEVVEMSKSKSESNEYIELQQTVVQLTRELNERDQEALLSDLDIGHLPEENGENVVHTVTVLAAKLGVPLEHRDVVFAERVGASESSGGGAVGETIGRARRVVVRLARRDLRDEFLRAARVRRNITTSDISPAAAGSASVSTVAPARRIYVNERLTKYNRQLFHRVREECRTNHWRYSWTRKGRIFARQSDGKQVHILRTDADLDRVFKTSPV